MGNEYYGKSDKVAMVSVLAGKVKVYAVVASVGTTFKLPIVILFVLIPLLNLAGPLTVKSVAEIP